MSHEDTCPGADLFAVLGMSTSRVALALMRETNTRLKLFHSGSSM
jgi:hypothetical protein